MKHSLIDNRNRWILLFTIAGVLWLYIRTAAPAVLWGDSGEIQRAAVTGIPIHSPGYPVYEVISYVWVRLFRIGNEAWRVNILSSVCAALAVGGVFEVVYRLTNRVAAACLAAVLLAVSGAYWTQALIAEVYGFHAFLCVGILFFLVLRGTKWRQYLVLAAFLFSLGVGHHPTIIFLIPAIVVHLWVRQREGVYSLTPRLLAGIVAICLSGLCWYAVTWFTAGWPSYDIFWGYITTSGGRYISFETPFSYFDTTVLPFLMQQLNIVGILGVGAGLIALLKGYGTNTLRVGTNWLFILYFLITLSFLEVNRVPDPEAFVPQFQLISAIIFGVGISAILTRLERVARTKELFSAGRFGIVFLIGSLLLIQTSNIWIRIDRSNDNAADLLSRNILESLPSDSAIVAGWWHNQPLRYQQEVTGIRPDIRIYLDIFPPSDRFKEYFEDNSELYIWGPGFTEAAESIGVELVNVKELDVGDSLYRVQRR